MKKWFMRQYWRIQQSQTLISMGFWTATLTLLIWPYVSWRFEAGSTMLGFKMTYWGLIGIGTSVLLTVLLIGRVYDATLGLWREHLTVVQERNPFTTYKLNASFGILLAQTNEILRRMAPEDEDIQRHCEFVDRWLDWNSEQEIWARTMSSWKNIVGDEDPFLAHLSETSRQNLASAADELQDY
ncbi:MAG: hypothetical protein CMB68_05630 [Euryarchaeota archaeon]|jgi:hypothetical protein|nr:hypothetical protein [Euryarchaeota archaeon]MBJ36363.1 hypothetical protein [Euryarchaeota archaeon]MBJ36805.1 hypothetical protein [Euryarchaeota archaeon]|tara:strand:- start:7978 stop:8529 length:552 start_codon:yes stop_codon:yes gene_type:complete